MQSLHDGRLLGCDACTNKRKKKGIMMTVAVCPARPLPVLRGYNWKSCAASPHQLLFKCHGVLCTTKHRPYCETQVWDRIPYRIFLSVEDTVPDPEAFNERCLCPCSRKFETSNHSSDTCSGGTTVTAVQSDIPIRVVRGGQQWIGQG